LPVASPHELDDVVGHQGSLDLLQAPLPSATLGVEADHAVLMQGSEHLQQEEGVTLRLVSLRWCRPQALGIDLIPTWTLPPSPAIPRNL
jgi:hypothetical protein